MFERAAAGPGLELKASHLLLHACGYALANKRQDTRAIQGWLGHRSITNDDAVAPRNWPLCGADKRRSGQRTGQNIRD
jgi:hypothetical protein